jgi:phosphatidylglycerol---prolipoprotein diacylglyceryl transferase
MIPILFRVGPITVYSYGLMVALGFVGAAVVLFLECRRRGIDTGYASSLVTWAGLAGLAGARLWDVCNNFQLYAAHPLSIIFSSSGFVWYGGFVGGFAAMYLVARHNRVRFLTTLDMAAPAVLVGHAFGRLGCLLSGDGDWGLPTKMPWGMAYPHAIVGWNSQTVLRLNARGQLVPGFYPGVRVQPTPIFEAVLYVAIAAFLLWAMRKRSWAEGRVFCLFLILSGGARFLVEFWRINPRVLWGLTEPQLFSIAMMAAGIAASLLAKVRKPATCLRTRQL